MRNRPIRSRPALPLESLPPTPPPIAAPLAAGEIQPGRFRITTKDSPSLAARGELRGLHRRRRMAQLLVLAIAVSASVIGGGAYVIWRQVAGTMQLAVNPLDEAAGSLPAQSRQGRMNARTPAKSTAAEREIRPRQENLASSSDLADNPPATFDGPLAGNPATGGGAKAMAPAAAEVPTAASKPTTPPTPVSPAAPIALVRNSEEQNREKILELYQTGKLFSKDSYVALRSVVADRFAQQHAKEMHQGLGDDYDAMLSWFAEHEAIRDELYIAIDPAADKIAEVFRVFNVLRKQFPDKLANYGELGVATALVWDQPHGGVYEYASLAATCKATLPAGLLEAQDNFEYLVAAEGVMQGRIRYAPWEFLVHVVNHRTPLLERQWALNGYLPQRAMFGKCYSTVPYDYLMLKTGYQQARLNGLEYTLPNLLALGGVCAVQADYAARVGKTLGVPSACVEGTANNGEGHAWVMWVELTQVSPTGIAFSLESHGRYRYDQYYVGHLTDPQTGKEISDRELELRLHMAGHDIVAKRQAKLAMQALPWINESGSLDTASQLEFLASVIHLAPGCEEAWLAAAKLGRESRGQMQYAKQFGVFFDALFATFARFPDFTWKVFNELTEYQTDVNRRNALYAQLVALYEGAGRPDLACEARLKLAELLVEQKRPLEAIEGLAFTIRKFPTEGRYVPKMLDRIESLSSGFPGADTLLVRFYTEILPQVPKYRVDEPSPYAMSMFKRAAETFSRCQQPQLAAAALFELQQLQATARPQSQ